MSTFSDDLTSAFSERLLEVMGGESAHAFAKRAGISYTAFKQYLEGGKPGMDKAAQIAHIAGVSLDWLATGKGEKTIAAEKSIIHKDLNAITPEIVQKAVAALKHHLDDKKSDMDAESMGEAAAIICEMAAAAGGFKTELIDRLLRLQSKAEKA